MHRLFRRLGGLVAILLLIPRVLASNPTPTRADSTGADDWVVAAVGSHEIWASEVSRRLSAAPPTAGDDPGASRRRALEPLIHRLLLREEAKRQGIMEAPEILEALEEEEAKRLEARTLERAIDHQLQVTDEAIDQAWRQASERRDVRILVVDDEAAAERLARLVAAGQDFAALAAEVEASAGELRRGVAPGELDPSLDAALFAAAPGQLAGPLAVRGGFALAQVEAVHGPDPAQRQAVSTQLLDERRQALEAALDQRLADELGFRAMSENIAILASRINGFNPDDPEHLDQPVAALEPADSTLTLFQTQERAYTIADFVEGFGAKRSLVTMRWAQAPEVLESDLKRSLRRQALIDLARADSLDQTDDHRAWRTLKLEELAVTRLYETVASKEEVTDQELRAHYETHTEDFTTPATVKVESWAFNDQSAATQLETALQGQLPDSVLEALATQAGAVRSGIERRITRTNFEADHGQKLVGDVVTSHENGLYWVGRVIGTSETRQIPFESVIPKVRRAVEARRVEERFAEFLDALRGRIPVVVEDAALARVPL